jgi:protein-tyrosine phosphatase
LIDRLQHRVLRANALRSLRAAPRPQSILFVCHGNICRSPFAEGVFRREIASGFAPGTIVSSAGYVSPNRPPPPNALTVAREFGVELAAHRSRLLTADIVAGADLVVVMSPRQARGVRAPIGRPAPPILVLGDIDPVSIDSREIRDPVKDSADVFREVYARIERCVKTLAVTVTALV